MGESKGKVSYEESEKSEDVTMSFEDFETQYGIRIGYPPEYEELPGFPVSQVGGFRWLQEEEASKIDAYAEGRKRKPLGVGINYYLYRLRRTLHLA